MKNSEYIRLSLDSIKCSSEELAHSWLDGRVGIDELFEDENGRKMLFSAILKNDEELQAKIKFYGSSEQIRTLNRIIKNKSAFSKWKIILKRAIGKKFADRKFRSIFCVSSAVILFLLIITIAWTPIHKMRARNFAKKLKYDMKHFVANPLPEIPYNIDDGLQKLDRRIAVLDDGEQSQIKKEIGTLQNNVNEKWHCKQLKDIEKKIAQATDFHCLNELIDEYSKLDRKFTKQTETEKKFSKNLEQTLFNSITTVFNSLCKKYKEGNEIEPTFMKEFDEVLSKLETLNYTEQANKIKEETKGTRTRTEKIYNIKKQLKKFKNQVDNFKIDDLSKNISSLNIDNWPPKYQNEILDLSGKRIIALLSKTKDEFLAKDLLKNGKELKEKEKEFTSNTEKVIENDKLKNLDIGEWCSKYINFLTKNNKIKFKIEKIEVKANYKNADEPYIETIFIGQMKNKKMTKKYLFLNGLGAYEPKNRYCYDKFKEFGLGLPKEQELDRGETITFYCDVFDCAGKNHSVGEIRMDIYLGLKDLPEDPEDFKIKSPEEKITVRLHISQKSQSIEAWFKENPLPQ